MVKENEDNNINPYGLSEEDKAFIFIWDLWYELSEEDKEVTDNVYRFLVLMNRQ